MIFSSDNPEGTTGAGAAAGFTDDDGQIPRLLAAGGTCRVCYQNLLVRYAAQHDEMAAGSEVSFGHKGYDQFAVGQSIYDPLLLHQ